MPILDVDLEAQVGSYAELTVGSMSLAFKYEAPACIAFLFEASEYFGPKPTPRRRGRRPDDRTGACGYRTTAIASRRSMDASGLSLGFFAELLDSFRPQLDELHHEFVTDQLAEKHDYKWSDRRLERAYDAEYRPKLESLRSGRALQDFVELLQDPPSEIRATVGPGDVWPIDFERIQSHFSGRLHEVRPGLGLMLLLLDESFFVDYPDVAVLLFLRLALESVPDDTRVELDLSEVTEDVADAIDFHAHAGQELAQRILIYNRAFRVLLSRQETLRSQVARQRCTELIERARVVRSRAEKGRSLEDLIETLFGSTDELQLQGRRVSTKDEEIDLVFRNRLKSPFWAGFASPLILVECKNWRERVDAKSVREFETKVRNRGARSKLGFFVAINGFTRAAEEALRRAAREDYHIVPVTGEAIAAYLTSAANFPDWLESQAAEVL